MSERGFAGGPGCGVIRPNGDSWAARSQRAPPDDRDAAISHNGGDMTHELWPVACLPVIRARKTDSQAARLRKGSHGGRPPGFDEERYKKRNTVERAINRLAQHRAALTRYDKRRYVYLGPATAAALTIWLRT